MLILTFIELILNSFVQASFSLSSQSIFYMNFYFIVHYAHIRSPFRLSSLLVFSSWCWLWCGRLFHYAMGLLPGCWGSLDGLLLLCLDLFVKLWSYLGITAAERGYKLSFVVKELNTFNEQLLFADRGYLALYYIRFFLYPIFYAVLINFSLKIIDPIFYRPNKWLNW